MGGQLRVGIVVGNPKPRSRTFRAARLVAERLFGRAPDVCVDIAELGPGVLDGADGASSLAVAAVRGLDAVVVASPTYKATYTGLLKVFLDRFPTGGLTGVIAVPLMLGAGPGHALAPEHTLRPLLVELGATIPTRAIYLLEQDWADGDVLNEWLSTAARQIEAAARVGPSVHEPELSR